MGTITFIRHGQANSSATDEESYDQLSDLGRDQARWLGEWFRMQGEVFDHIRCGTLRRHVQTAEAMGISADQADPRLNEMDYFNLSEALEKTAGISRPTGDGFAHHIPVLLEAWHRAEISGQESFAAFEARVAGLLDDVSAPGRNVLCVTSGGVIGMIMRILLELSPRRMAHVLLPIHNTAITRVHVTPVGEILAGFNAIPHLAQAERAHARTHF